MDLSIVLSGAAASIYVVAFLDYNRALFKGETDPKLATWFIWSMVSLVSAPSYLKVSGDFWKSVIPLFNIMLCFATFVFVARAAKKKKARKELKKKEEVDPWDPAALTIGIGAAAAWWIFRSAAYAQIIVQFAIVVGFVPTWRGIRNWTTTEESRPWWLWTLSYVFATTVVVMRWKGQWIDLLYPGLCMMLHASVPIATMWQVRTLFPRHSAEWGR